MAVKFKKGDVVELKSSSPPMTIELVPGDNAKEYPHKPMTEYACVWFKGAEKKRGFFEEHLLQPYVPPVKK